MSENKKIFFLGLIALLFGGLLVAFLIFKEKREVIPPTSIEIQKEDNEQKIAFWKEKPEEKEVNLPSIEKFIFKGELRMREKGKVEKIIEQGKLYQLNLSFHGINVVEINEKTYLGRTIFGYNKEGSLLAIEYTPISFEEIEQIKPGQEVIVSFKQDELFPGKNIPLLEFILLFKEQ